VKNNEKHRHHHHNIINILATAQGDDRIINKRFGETITAPTTDKIETTNNGRAGIQIYLDNRRMAHRPLMFSQVMKKELPKRN
jgi:hypothetical protein